MPALFFLHTGRKMELMKEEGQTPPQDVEQAFRVRQKYDRLARKNQTDKQRFFKQAFAGKPNPKNVLCVRCLKPLTACHCSGADRIKAELPICGGALK